MKIIKLAKSYTIWQVNWNNFHDSVEIVQGSSYEKDTSFSERKEKMNKISDIHFLHEC